MYNVGDETTAGARPEAIFRYTLPVVAAGPSGPVGAPTDRPVLKTW